MKASHHIANQFSTAPNDSKQLGEQIEGFDFEPKATQGRESIGGSYTTRSSSNQMHALPVQFHLKTIFWQNLLNPSLYLLLQTFVSFSLWSISIKISDDSFLSVMGNGIFPILTVMTYVFYLLAACTNPGFIIGNEQIQLAKAQDYDMKHNHTPVQVAETQELGGLSHKRQKSVLHKEMVSRHDRNKSAQYTMNIPGQGGSYAGVTTVNPSAEQYELANLDSLPSFSSTPMEKTLIKHQVGSGSLGQYDSQMSLQLYGNATTNSSTVPSGKGGKKIPANIKGIQTNQKQLEAKDGSAFDLIQKRIKEAQKVQNVQNQLNIGQNFYELDDPEADGGQQQIVDDFGTDMMEEEDHQQYPSDGLQKIRESLNLGPSAPQQLAVTEEVYDFEASQRIDHLDVDGSLDIQLDISNSRKLRKQRQQIEVIQEEIEDSLEKTNIKAQIEVVFDDEQPGGTDADHSDDDEDVVLFIEYKYCTICHIEQPLRTKHCKHCDHCVATHDHHCPWIGNCVGERNRFWFFWFIQMQFIQLIVGLIMCFQINLWNKQDNEQLSEGTQVLALFLFLICIGFTLFVLPLSIFHTYLISVNLTSWEFLSWMRITYLKVWPKKYGSPFSQGLSGNLKMFFTYNFRKNEQCYQWQMPKTLPKLQQN